MISHRFTIPGFAVLGLAFILISATFAGIDSTKRIQEVHPGDLLQPDIDIFEQI